MCVRVLLRGKGHEDLPSGFEQREQGEGVFRGSFSGEQKEACWAAIGWQASAVEETETYEYKLFVFRMKDGNTALQ